MRRRLTGAPPEDTPFAFVERQSRTIVLTSVNPVAAASGLHAGQRHADARAIQPQLLTEPMHRDRNAQALQRLASWCMRWSPSVALCPPDGLYIEVAGSAHLFGGESGLLRDMADRLAAAEIPARLAIAPTPGAAWAAARFSGRSASIVDDVVQDSAGWPLAALRLDHDVLVAASALSLKHISDLHCLPRAGLARRFGNALGLGLVERLDQLTGAMPEALTMIEPPRRYAARRIFVEPVTETPGVAAALPALLAELAAQLERAALGATELRLTGYRIDGEITGFGVRLGASRNVSKWGRLLATAGLEQLDLGFGVDALALTASATGVVTAADCPLDGDDTTREPLPELIDRLAARLGADRILIGSTRDSWLPERAERWLPAQGRTVAAIPALDRPRPLLMLDPPEPVEASLFDIPEGAPARFRWRRVERRVRRAEGPERLSPEWWRNARRPRRTRDYYRVEDDTGARFWLFREGLYEWEDGPNFGNRPPTWWMHGLFA